MALSTGSSPIRNSRRCSATTSPSTATADHHVPLRERQGRLCASAGRIPTSGSWSMRPARSLFGAYRNPLTDDPTASRARSAAPPTPTCFVHGGKLYALKEDSPAIVDGPEHARDRRLHRFRRQDDRRDLHRPSQDRSRDRRHDRLRLCRQGRLTRDMVYYEIEPGRRAQARDLVRASLLLHDARLRR